MTSPARSIPGFVSDQLSQHYGARIRVAIVTGNDTDQVFVRQVGYADADPVSYPKLSGVTVAANDEVILLDLNGQGGFVVLGKILRN